MNHCVLEVQVKKAPTVRYTQDNKTPIAEMEVLFDGLRADDSPGELKVVGWGNMAQELQNRVQTGQKLVLEGRLRMNTIPRQDGTKEKKAELTLSKFHNLPTSNDAVSNTNNFSTPMDTSHTAEQSVNDSSSSKSIRPTDEPVKWNTAPLVPDTDDIPF